VDRGILIRSSLLLAFDLFYWGKWRLQVLFAIGMGFLLMIWARRLSRFCQIAVALGILLLSEAIILLFVELTHITPVELGNRLARNDGEIGVFRLIIPFMLPGPLAEVYGLRFTVQYPFVPWAAMMLLGWVFGNYILDSVARPDRYRTLYRYLLGWGFAALLLFVAVRGLNGYGNIFLYRSGNSVLQWLHVSKYPPSLAFCGLELGLMCLILAGLFKVQQLNGEHANRWNPLLVFGQTALFFYLVHNHAMLAVARLAGWECKLGLGATWIASGFVLIGMYPLCLFYRFIKGRYPGTILRYM
jgi:uncharacterized membrane protein